VPEGQVSHRNAIRLGAALNGQVIVRVDAPDPRVAPQRLEERLTGRRVAAVSAEGKHHLIRFDSDVVLHSHLGMGGRWRVAPAGRPPPRRGLWVALWTERHVAAQYGGPRLRLYGPGEPIPAIASLGPDLLATRVDAGEATARALARVDPERPVGDALMDQRVVAGIGTVYRSETLFLCGINPWRAVGALTADEAAGLGRTASRLLAEGVRHRGPITTYRSPDPRGRERTWVYGRSGKPCRRCGTPVASRGMGDANRTVSWCPTCQT
jgi:endonuclease-8